MNKLKLAGIIGLIGAIFCGTGEFLLHFNPALLNPDPEVKSSAYEFMAKFSEQRLTIGHFFAVISVPLYFVGVWHIGEMLQPAGKKLSTVFCFIGWYGFLYGAMWMSSRAMIGSIVHHPDLIADTDLVALYELRLETLLQVIRITTLIISVIYIKMVLSGKTRYPKWMAATSPIVLLIISIALFFVAPRIGIYTMPIALNVGFGLFFLLSLIFGDTSDNFQPKLSTS